MTERLNTGKVKPRDKGRTRTPHTYIIESEVAGKVLIEPQM